MRRFLPTLVLALVLLSCRRAATPEVATPRKAPVAAASSAAAAIPSASVPAADPRVDALYRSATEKMDRWNGDGTILASAHKDLLEMVRLNDRDPRAYAGLSRWERASGYVSGMTYQPEKLANARKFAQHGLKLDPDSFECHVELGSTYAVGHDLDEARAEAAAARALRPDSSRPGLIELTAAEAEAEAGDGDGTAILAIVNDMIAKNKWDAPGDEYQVWETMASLASQSGFQGKADEAYRRCVQLEPKNAWAHGNYASYLLGKDDLDGAIAEGERAVALLPYPIAVSDLSRAYVRKARTLYDEKNYDAAGALIERAVRLSPGNAGAQVALGGYYYTVFVRTSDAQYLRKAKEAYGTAAKLDPTNKEVAQALETIRKREERG